MAQGTGGPLGTGQTKTTTGRKSEGAGQQDFQTELDAWKQRVLGRTVAAGPGAPPGPAQAPAPKVSYPDIYAELTADVGTEADAESVRWVTNKIGPSALEKLVSLEHQADHLAKTEATEADYRAAVGRLVNQFHHIRKLHADGRAGFGED